MSTPSNLYAEKIFAEHPIGLWPFDDKADYVSLISEEQRDLSTSWTVLNGLASTDVSRIDQPFKDSVINLLVSDIPSEDFSTIVCTGQDLYNFTKMNPNYGTFAIGAYIYVDSAFAETVSIGYEYTDISAAQIVENVVEFPLTVLNKWVFVSSTFKVLDEDATIRPILKIKSSAGGVNSENYQYYVNGITVGQWSEEFNALSLGVEQENFPTNIALDQDYALTASAYGVDQDKAYYLISGGALLGKNTSIPMVYGASGTTKLIQNENKPSLIVPGKGFLNKVGQFNEYTVEFWARINSDTSIPKKIFGPISSPDGLYVESGFLTFVVGDKFGSHFVGEWFRPMLIDIRLIRNFVSVLVNGEDVISFSIDTNTLSLPNEFNEEGKSQDWLGFYTYEDVTPIEIDCVAIYSYQVSETVAKRRFVYGQAVISPEGINAAYSGTTSFIDYPFTDYTSNYNYPSFADWEQGAFDNLSTTGLYLTTPQYSLPNIFLETKNIRDLYKDNNLIQNEDKSFITFRPNENWNNDICYFNFSNFNIINTSVSSFYGVFSSSDFDSEEVLIKIYNTLNKDYFLIIKEYDQVVYYFNYNGVKTEIYRTSPLVLDEKYFVGINIDKIKQAFGANISYFFGNENSLSMYVGGDDSGDYQFKGKIYSIGISSQYNASLISHLFDNLGIAITDDLNASGAEEPENANFLVDFVSSYTLLPSQAYSAFFLDIGVSGYWEDYLPLSYFAQFVNNAVGSDFYDLDFLQFNIGYPSPSTLFETEEIDSWSYAELATEYGHPIQKTYSQLSNQLITGWANYEDMAQKSVKFYEYETNDLSVQSYVTFQFIENGANLLPTSFPNRAKLKQGKIIDVSEYSQWRNTKFEIVDGSIIYPRKDIDFNKIAIVYHIDFNIRGILTKPISIRNLEIASQAFNENSFNPIGTRFGVDLFPYKKSGLYFDYKSKNPFSVHKRSTPYLYLTRDSGIQVRGEFDPSVSRGISMPINSGLAPEFSVSALQIWMRYDEDLFPGLPQELFEVSYLEDTIKFYFVADTDKGNRARVFAKSLNTGQEYNGLTYYWNGKLVREPVMTSKEWGVLGITFANSLPFNAFLGSLNMTGPVVFNNIAFYQANNLQRIQSTSQRPWVDIKTDFSTDPSTEFMWRDWWGPNPGDGSFSWLGVLVVGTTELYGVNPSKVYETYLGTNKIIVDDNAGIEFSDDKLLVYSEILWQTSQVSAV